MQFISRRHSVFMVMNGSTERDVPNVVSFVTSQAEALQNAGWTVHVGVVDDRTSPIGVLRNIRRLRTEIARAKPLLVHAQYGSVTAAVANATRGDRPLVVSFCGDDLLGTPTPGFRRRLRSKAARQIGAFTAFAASAVIVKSWNLFDALPKSLRTRAIVLPNGVDIDFFLPLETARCREQLGWDQHSQIVLFNASHGDNAASKNPKLANRVVSSLSASFPGVIMKTMSKNSKEQVRLMLNAADCLLVTSIHEGSPNIVKEAMACNLPVVSVNCGDVAERLRGVAPSAVCNYDPQELAESIGRVLRNKARSNGREQLMAQGLSGSAVAEQLITLYNRIITRQPCAELQQF